MHKSASEHERYVAILVPGVTEGEKVQMKTRAQKYPFMENQRPTQNNQPQSGIHHFQVPSQQFGRPVLFGGNPNHVFGEDIGLTIFWEDFFLFLSPALWESCPAKGILRGFWPL